MEEVTNNQIQNKRPQLLTVIAILSFIGSGFSFFSYLMMSLYYHEFLSIVEGSLAEMYSQMGINVDTEVIIEFFRKAGRLFFVLNTLAYAGSLFGVYRMWNLNKSGLHYYALSQIVIIILPLIFVSTQLSVFPGMILTAIFILMYYRSFKILENE